MAGIKPCRPCPPIAKNIGATELMTVGRGKTGHSIQRTDAWDIHESAQG